MFGFNAHNRYSGNANKKWRQKKWGNRNRSECEKNNRNNNSYNNNDVYGNEITKKENIYDIYDYLSNVSYIVNDKYEKYFVYEVKEDKLKKGNHAFNDLNLDFVYNLEEDISLIETIKNEIKGYELELLERAKFAKLLEKLINYCFFLLKYNEERVNNKDISIQCLEIYNHFYKIVKSNFLELSQLTYASHFTQSVVSVLPFFAKYEQVYINEIKKEDNSYEEIVEEGFLKICDIIIENIFIFLFNKFGTHVLRSFFYVIAGYLHINISYRKSKINKKAPKNELNYLYTNFSHNEKLFSYFPKIIEKLTEEFENPLVSLEHKNILYQYLYSDPTKDKVKERQNEKAKEKAEEKEVKEKMEKEVKEEMKEEQEREQLKEKKRKKKKDKDKKKNKENNEEKMSDYLNDIEDELNNSKDGEKGQTNNTEEKVNSISNNVFDELVMESKNQHLICPLLYNVYSVGALTTFFEIVKEKNIECKNLCSKIFLIEQTKKYNFQKAHGKISNVTYASPLNQLLDILLKSREGSILIERILKTKLNEHIFYVFSNYILHNLNTLLLEDIFSYTVLCNYFYSEFITAEMFDMIMKNIDLIPIIENKKFTIVNRLFELSRYYQIHCKHLVHTLLKGFNLLNKNNSKFMWICIINMQSYDQLPDCVKCVLKNKDGNMNEVMIKDEPNTSVQPILNNYNFIKYIVFNKNGCEILSYMLDFPREAITPLIGSFSSFCQFLEIVSQNKASEEDISNYQNYCDFLFSRNTNRYSGNGHANENSNFVNTCDENFQKIKNEDQEINKINKSISTVDNISTNGDIINKDVVNDSELQNNCSNVENQFDVENSFDKEEMSGGKRFSILRKLDMIKNILFYFSCCKLSSMLCEKISHFFNVVNEKYLRKFILLFKEMFQVMAADYIGCYVIVTFFKLGTNELKKSILDELIKGDIYKYNSYIKKYMRLKEYMQTKVVNVDNKYTKVKKLFEDILVPKEEKSIMNSRDNGMEKENYQRESEKKCEKESEKENEMESVKESEMESEMESEGEEKKLEQQQKKKKNPGVKKKKKEKRKEKEKEKEKKIKKKVKKEIEKKEKKKGKEKKQDQEEKDKEKKKKEKDKDKLKKAEKNKKKNERKENNAIPTEKKDSYIETTDVLINTESDSSNLLQKGTTEEKQKNKQVEEDALVNVISNFISSTKKKSRKRKKEKEIIERVLKKQL